MLTKNSNNWLLPLVVVGVVGCALYMAVRNNNFDVVNAMAVAIISYYFGAQRQSLTTFPPNTKSHN